MRILYINEITPGQSLASSVVLERHLQKCPVPWEILSEQDISVPRIIQTIRNRVLSKVVPLLAFYVESHIEARLALGDLAKRLSPNNYDMVLTLAHGRLGLHSWCLAKALELPQVTIFHDWWPELLASSTRCSALDLTSVSNDFTELQRQSDLCFAVCEGMAEHLTEAGKVEVLYPIPDESITSRPSKPSRRLRVTYAGSLWQPYGKMIVSLADQLAGNKNIDFRVYGESKYLDATAAARMETLGILFPIVPQSEFNDLITAGSDLLIGVMGDDHPGKVRMKTSFPSKVANYFRSGNATLIWAPAPSSLGKFARAAGALVENDLSAEKVAHLINKISKNPALLQSEKSKSLAIGEKYFNPANLHQSFMRSLYEVKDEFYAQR